MAPEHPLFLGEPAKRLDPRMIFAPDHSFMYVAIPKTGCTTIKMILAAAVGLFDPIALQHQTKEIIHSIWNNRHGSWNSLTETARASLLTSASTLRFTSVRNPYERIVSCYLNKIFTRDRNSAYLAWRVQGHGKISLLDFLKFVQSQPPLRRDAHCRVMSDLCFSEYVRYDDIVRYETFEHDIKRVMEMLNIGNLNIPTPSRKNKTDAGAKMHALLGDPECELIREIYKADFEEFGYSTALPDVAKL